ncbi:MAG TPA: hypothetical protein ENK18_07600 [Deltaproteobacteria bacterium]|nr:hypothetical protein [Deltaproteobacteria bacterium]
MSQRLEAYRRESLEPARVAPMSIAHDTQRIEVGAVIARARSVRPEDAAWNRWASGGVRLFNNRAAHLFEIRVVGRGPLSWVPEHTQLELNDETVIVPAAETTEAMLTDLLYMAFLEQRWSLEGDLVERARSAGPFRSAYLPLYQDEGALEGVIAFPLLGPDGSSLADLHVVAARLTVQILVDGRPTELVWVFD